MMICNPAKRPISHAQPRWGCGVGFTIVELLVTLAIFAFLVALGVPAINTTRENMAVKSSADRLASAFAYARSEAVSRAVSVSVCAGVSTCAANDWATGWTVFTDDNGDGNRSSSDEILRVEDISANGVSVTGGPNVVTFDRLGENAAAVQYQFQICGGSGSVPSSRSVTISSVGYGLVGKGGATCP